MNIVHYFLAGVVVFFANMLESITGFGATVVELPFISMLFGIKTAVVALSMVSLTLSLFVIIRYRKKINMHVYKTIVFYTLIGMPVGMLAFAYLPERMLKIWLGVFIIFAAIREILIVFHKKISILNLKGWHYRVIIFVGGIIHGAFASGGPFLIVYAADRMTEKDEFRATMCSVWATLNTVLLIKYMFTGAFVPQTVLPVYLLALPFLIAGITAGFKLYKKVSEHTFSIIVCAVLAAAGGTMLGLAIAS